MHRTPSGQPAAGAGLLAPHVDLLWHGERKRLDDIVAGGSGFVVISRGFDPQAPLGVGRRARLAVVGARYLALDETVTDLDGRLDAFMIEQGWAAMIVRPDFYVYGGAASPADLAAVTDQLLADLAEAGVKGDPLAPPLGKDFTREACTH